MSEKLIPGTSIPALDLTLINGEHYYLGQQRDHWELLVVYRGKHCPRCKTYLSKLQNLLPSIAQLNVRVIVVSADPIEKVQSDIEEFQWTFPIAYGLSISSIKALGLWASAQADGSVFSEPGVFLINPEHHIQVMSISNAASCRPDLEVLLDGINGIQTRGLPIFGTVELANYD